MCLLKPTIKTDYNCNALLLMVSCTYTSTLCSFMALALFLLKVKNKMPASVQITAEQLLREAKERELELVAPVSFCLYLENYC